MVTLKKRVLPLALVAFCLSACTGDGHKKLMDQVRSLKQSSILVRDQNQNQNQNQGPGPNLIIHNAQIYTANKEQETVQAIAIRNDRIVAVGSNNAVLALSGESSELLDLQGALVLPGLHDTHIHPSGIIQYDSCNLNSSQVNLQELSEFVKSCVEDMDIPEGEWLSVRQWSFGEGNLPAGGFKTVRQALDAATTVRPVILLGNDGHHHATNTVGLSLAKNQEGKQVGLSAETLQKEFSAFIPFVGIDESGEPNGAINEGTHRILGAPGLLEADIPLLARHADQIPRRLNSLGITSIQDAAVSPAVNLIYDELLASGQVPLRIRLAQHLIPDDYVATDGQLDMTSLLADAIATRNKYAPIENINANALKFFVDGVLEGNPLANPPTLPNAAMQHPFHQPRFQLDEETQQVRLQGYVDIDGSECRQWRVDSASDLGGSQAFVQAFLQDNGFHPAQCQQSSGVMYSPAENAMSFVQRADEAGFAVHLHAIGDLSVKTAIDAIASVSPESTSLNRHSITHLQVVSDEDIQRLGALKIPLALTYAWARKFPQYDATVIPFIEKMESLADMYDPGSYYYQHFYPAKSIQNAGGILAAGSDAPVETDDPRPFLNIEAAVTRDGGHGIFNAAQRLDILDAIDAYTINGARLLGQQNLTGSLEVGKKADFVVLADNIIALAKSGDASKIHRAAVLQTWFDGRLVYEKE